MLAVLHGRRKLATFRRQCLLELGKPAWMFLGQLVHDVPNGCWEKPCTDLFDLLRATYDEAMCAAFARCCTERRYTVDAVRAALAAA